MRPLVLRRARSDAVGNVRQDAYGLVQMSRHKGLRQHRNGHEDPVADELELHPPGLDVQVIEHLGGARSTRDIVHDCREDHHLLAVPGGPEEEHGRSDSDRHIAFGVADRPMAVHLRQLGVDQVVQMLLVTWHGRRQVGPLQLQDLDRSVGLDRRRSRLKHLGELVGSKEDRVLDAVDIT